jgi:hypothetical protein
MNVLDYFLSPKTVPQKQYEALRAFFVDNLPASKAAESYGYKLRAFNSLVADFRKKYKDIPFQDPFFINKKKGRKFKDNTDCIIDNIVEMRKKNFSVGDIKAALDSKGFQVSEKFVYLTLKRQGFARLPRRSNEERLAYGKPKIKASKSVILELNPEQFNTNTAGVLIFLPLIQQYGIIRAISDSRYPETQSIDKITSILAFLALKLSNIRRYSTDDLWCMDRGSGLFAGLNVLPKTAWYSSYSSRITKEMNRSFLRSLHTIWRQLGLLGDTVNLDFVTIPYWGDDSHLENNWSGKRGKSLASMLAVLAQEPDSGIIDYGDTDVQHRNEHSVILEFLDFYREGNPGSDNLRYLVFDSKFTNYQNLKKLDEKNIKFITIRRRGKNIVDNINKIPASNWRKIHIMNANGKGRALRINDQTINLKEYNGNIRQISITGHGKIKPAIIITNDFEISVENLVRKYSRRWLVEKTIAEQTEFFHLNRVSSSMVIKVDFDLTMTILAHNLYRLFALETDRYSHLSDIRVFEKFISNAGEVEIGIDKIQVKLKKKRELPKILEVMNKFECVKISHMNDFAIQFSGLSYS